MAKWLGRNKGLGVAIEKQDKFQGYFVKINPALMNVSSALLKWSIPESNLSLYDVFSAWSDLDHALDQLSKAVLPQLFAFKQKLENINREGKNLAKLQADAEIASKRVKQAVSKLENAKKAKKKDKDQVKVDNCESELTLAMGSEKGLKSSAAAKEKEFELNKAKWVKEILTLLSRTYVAHLTKSLEVWKEKLSVAEAMADKPVYHAEELHTESARKVSAIFHKLSMDLPQREPPVDKSRTLPNQPPPIPDKGFMTKDYVTTVLGGGSSQDDDDDDDEAYATPDDPPTGDHNQDYLVATVDKLEKETPPPAPPRSPPAPPRSPPPIPASSASSLNDDTSSTSSSSNMSDARRDVTGRGGFKVLPTLPSPKLERHIKLTQSLSLPGAGEPANPPSNRGMPPSPHPKTPSVPKEELYHNEPAEQQIVPLPRLPERTITVPSEPPPRLPDKMIIQPNEPPPKLPDKPITNKKPAILPKPARHQRPPKQDQASSKESLDLITEHEYSDVPIEVDDQHDIRAGAREEINSFLHNNNIKQVVESDSDFSDDYELVSEKK